MDQIPEKLRPLARLHPGYAIEELEEAYEMLRRYVRIGLRIANRLEREGRLEEVLTNAKVNPTVKPPDEHSPLNS